MDNDFAPAGAEAGAETEIISLVPAPEGTGGAGVPVPLSRADELNSAGAKFFSMGQLEPARYHFLAALLLQPEHHLALQNLGAVLRSQGHHLAAASVARRSVRASAGKGIANALCRSNLGVAQLSLRQFSLALATLRGVLDDLPDSGPSWHNYGLVLYTLGQYESALTAFDHARGFPGMGPQVDSDRAITLLALCRLPEALEAYEARWKILDKSRIWKMDIPEWQGEPLTCRRVLVHHEQGFGDSIMLSRFLLQLYHRGAEITVAVPRELVRLFDVSFSAYATVVDLNDERIGDTLKFDYHSPMMSLMRHLGIRGEKNILPLPYLAPEEDDPVLRHIPNHKFRIGICWASGNHGKALAERRRIVPVTLFLPLTEIPDFGVISLQKGREANDLALNGMEGLVYDLGLRLEDFASTAAVISKLDMVISVDSAVAHLAGALGVPCMMLSPYTRCWRWWNSGTGMPWYQHMTVFRQDRDGTWDEAVGRAISLTRAKVLTDMDRPAT